MAKILITEDERIIAEDLKLTLQSFGHEVAAICASGEEAVTKTRELLPDLIFMDIQLKGKLTGIDAAHILKSSKIPIIFCTAYSDHKTIMQAASIDHSGYLIKPIMENELKCILDKFLNRKSSKIPKRRNPRNKIKFELVDLDLVQHS
jgi:CheY-like chemotaxis protein